MLMSFHNSILQWRHWSLKLVKVSVSILPVYKNLGFYCLDFIWKEEVNVALQDISPKVVMLIRTAQYLSILHSKYIWNILANKFEISSRIYLKYHCEYIWNIIANIFWNIAYCKIPSFPLQIWVMIIHSKLFLTWARHLSNKYINLNSGH